MRNLKAVSECAWSRTEYLTVRQGFENNIDGFRVKPKNCQFEKRQQLRFCGVCESWITFAYSYMAQEPLLELSGGIKAFPNLQE